VPVPRSLRPAVTLAVSVSLLAGCYSFAQPSHHPGTSRQLLVAIARRVVDARPMVGDSACSDRDLVANAIHLRTTVASDPVERDVWIYAFRPKGWEATEAPVDACQAEYAAANPGSTITRIDIPIYRAFGADWSPELEAAVREGLREASTMGLPGQ
jgi:hypothetical protein